MKSPRVVFFGNTFLNERGQAPDGVARHLSTVGRSLKNEGWRCVLVLPEGTYAHGMFPIITVPSLPFPPAGPEYRTPHPLALPHHAMAVHRVRNAAVFHAHCPSSTAIVAARHARRHGIPFFFTFHTLYLEYAELYTPDYLPIEVVQLGIKVRLQLLARKCSAIIAPSEYTARHICELGISAPIEVIPTGVPIPSPRLVSTEARSCLFARLGIKEGSPLLVSAGRQGFEKNLGLVIDAFGLIASKFPQVHLVLAGAAGAATPSLKLQAERLGLSHRVIFPGQLGDELSALYSAPGSLHTSGSVSETQGLTVWEAAACGMPSVVTDQGGIGEMVCDKVTGRVLPADHQAFAQAYCDYFSNKLLRTSWYDACMSARSERTPAMTAKRLSALYELHTNLHPRP